MLQVLYTFFSCVQLVLQLQQASQDSAGVQTSEALMPRGIRHPLIYDTSQHSSMGYCCSWLGQRFDHYYLLRAIAAYVSSFVVQSDGYAISSPGVHGFSMAKGQQQ